MAGHTADRVFVTDLPQSTCNWPYREDVVHKVFKVRTCSFGVDSIFWPNDKDGKNLDSWFDKCLKVIDPNIGSMYKHHFAYLDTVLADLDIVDIKAWYSKEEKSLIKNTIMKFAAVFHQIDETNSEQSEELPRHVCKQIKNQEVLLKKWLRALKFLLQTEPSSLNNKSFEECFRFFVEMAGLYCHGQIISKLRLTYEYEIEETPRMWQINSEPDLLLFNANKRDNLCCVAVVEVKSDPVIEPPSCSEDRTSKSGEATKPPRVANKTGDEEDNDIELLKMAYTNGQPKRLTESQKRDYRLFLPQLLGDVAAVANTPKLKYQEVIGIGEAQRSVLGVAVVGFSVYFVNFISVIKRQPQKRKWSLHDIPVTKGLGVDILISEPLNMLNRCERNKLIKALCAIKTLNYKDFSGGH